MVYLPVQKVNQALRVLVVLLLVAVAFSGCSLFGNKLVSTIVEGESMMPTLQDKQEIKLKPTKQVTLNDIIVFEHHKDEKGEPVYHVKRVIGIPGDTIQFVGVGDNYYNVFLNGELLEEDYTLDGTKKPSGSKWQAYEFFAGTDEYFVMGDNRYVSNDSRHNGCINKSQIFGKVVDLP